MPPIFLAPLSGSRLPTFRRRCQALADIVRHWVELIESNADGAGLRVRWQTRQEPCMNLGLFASIRPNVFLQGTANISRFRPKPSIYFCSLLKAAGGFSQKKSLWRRCGRTRLWKTRICPSRSQRLRKALGGEGTEWIETLPRYGYRFAGEVLEISPNHGPEPAVWTPPEVVSAPLPPVSPVDYSRPGSFLLLASSRPGLPLFAGWLAVAYFREKPPEERAISFLITPPDLVTTPDADSIAISPTGDRVVFIGVGPDGSKQLWMRPLGSLTADIIPGTELVDGAFWSPDGRSVAFFASGKLKKMDLQSAAPQTICDTPAARSAGSWSENGEISFSRLPSVPKSIAVSASGGVPKAVTRLNSSNHEIHHSAPQFLPDGRHFIYFVQSERPENSGIYIGSLDSRDSQRLTNSNANAAYTRVRGAYYLLFPRDTNLMGQAFDVSGRELIGTPFVVAPRLLIGLGGGHPRAALSVSQNGVLAYRTRVDTGSTDLEWFDRKRKTPGRGGRVRGILKSGTVPR